MLQILKHFFFIFFDISGGAVFDLTNRMSLRFHKITF